MIEYVEENILGSLFTGKFMNVVNNQNINHLVKMNKVVLVVISNCLNELSLELSSINIQNGFFGLLIFNLNPNCLP